MSTPSADGRTLTCNKAPPPMRWRDTWKSHFRSGIFCYSENTPLNLPVHTAGDDARRVTGIKHSKMPTEASSRSAAGRFRGERGRKTSAHGRTPAPASGPSRLPFASARKTDTHARGRAHPTHVYAERDAKGDGAGRERVSFNFPVTIADHQDAHKWPK